MESNCVLANVICLNICIQTSLVSQNAPLPGYKLFKTPLNYAIDRVRMKVIITQMGHVSPHAYPHLLLFLMMGSLIVIVHVPQDSFTIVTTLVD